jgi:hypothetical protein
MAYTRPAYNDADASWLGLVVYTRPDYDDADATFYAPTIATVEGILTDGGLPAASSFTSTPWVVSLLADDGFPLAPSIHALFGVGGWLSDGGLPAAPSFVAAKGVVSWLSDEGLPSPLSGAMYTDPTPFIDPDASVHYVMDLLVDGELVRVPISSWQSTLQTDSDNYMQCVVPACGDWLDTINAATEFVVSRVSTLYPAYGSASVEGPLVRGPVQTVAASRGATNYSAVISGYTDPLPENDDPDAIYDRELQDVRSIATYGETISIRCGIDWLLRPGQRAVYGSVNFVVSYINYYVTSYAASVDAYMDVGRRT